MLSDSELDDYVAKLPTTDLNDGIITYEHNRNKIIMVCSQLLERVCQQDRYIEKLESLVFSKDKK